MKYASKTQKSDKLENINNYSDICNNTNILDVLTKYTILYLDSKLAANLSEKAIYNSKIILKRFYIYVAEEFSDNEYLSITDISKYFINNYINRLTQDGLSKNTQKLHLTVLKGYFIFIADSELEQFGFLKLSLGSIKIKTEQKEKDSLGQAEQTKLLNYVAGLDAKKSYLAQRNALLIKVLLYTGVRISELINIKWTDIAEHYDDKHGYIYVILLQGKGNKERYTYLLHDEVKENFEFLKLNSAASPYLFVSTQGNQCNRSSLFDVVKNLMQQAGINKSGLHIFRHTFARSLVDKDVNLSTIKDLLGHSNITVTAQFYAKSNENAKRNALFHNTK